MNTNLNFQHLVDSLPEQDLWQLLQGVISSEVELDDEVVQSLDDRMQGFLFLQDCVTNRKARILFARSPRHMPYLRDAAGSRNVWMEDDEFTTLVEQDDPVTLACFARSELMKPHHLAYIVYKLAQCPHGDEQLATTDEATITMKKALEHQGNSRQMDLFRLARLELEHAAGDDSTALWRTYLYLKSLDERTLSKRLDQAGLSTGRPVRTSGKTSRAIH